MRSLRLALVLVLLLLLMPATAQAKDAGPASGGAPATSADAGPSAGSGVGGTDAGGIVVPDHMMPHPDAPDVMAGVAERTVLVGRPFSLFITITHQAGVEVNVPSAIVAGGAFDELRRTYTDSTSVDGRKIREYEIQLMAWLVGEQMLPPIDVVYVVQGEAHRTRSAPVGISVVGVIGDGEESLRDIVPPVTVERTNLRLVYLAAIGIAGLLLCVVVILVLRARRRRPEGRRARRDSVAVLALQPDARALARLEALEASGSLENEDCKPGYLELSEILREYLGSRYCFAALDSTTSEIKVHITAQPDGRLAMTILDRWLDQVDLVKYASHRPGADEISLALSQARELVERCAGPAPLEETDSAAPTAQAVMAPDVESELAATSSASVLARVAASDELPFHPDHDDAGDTLRGMPSAGRGQSRWEPPADYVVNDSREATVTEEPDRSSSAEESADEPASSSREDDLA